MKGGNNIKYFKEIILSINLIATFTILGLIFYKFYYLDYFNEDENEVVLASADIREKEIETSNKITVEIKGAVKEPNVYSFDKKAIVNELVIIAGGFLDNAYTDNINLSMKLDDQMVVYVFTKKEYEKLGIKEEKQTKIETCKCPDIDISKCTKMGQSIIEKSDSKTIINSTNSTNNFEKTDEITLVNINTANITELTTLSGIGEAKAKSIIDYREENGNFEAIEDIVNVSGISENTYEKIKNYITI